MKYHYDRFPVKGVEIDPEDLKPSEGRTGPRVVRDPVTGYSYVTARPGARKITVEDVKKELEDFP